jgi:hypothetical protein
MSWNTAQEFRIEGGGLTPYCNINGVLRPVAWAALPGSQAAFLACSETVVLFQGGRGATGKSEALVADFLQDVGIGMGADHKGILIRRTYPELEDIKAVAAKIIPRIFPTASYNETQSMWTFADGATLRFRPFLDASEWDRFHGRNVTWIGLDELATWRTLEPMQMLLSILRSSHPLARPRLRACTNTWGAGRDAILEYFNLTPAAAPTIGPLITGGGGPPRRVVTGNLLENIPLLTMQPDYFDALRAATKDNPAKMAAWIDGIWAAPPNMFFGDIDWSAVTIPDFEPPNPGRVRVGYDHGLTAPSASVFCYESRGEDIEFPDGSRKPTLRGDTFVLDEFVAQSKPGVGPKPPLYPRDIAERLHAVVERHGWNHRLLMASGNIADTAIFSPGMGDNRASVADDFERAHIRFEPADKSRVLGAAEMLKRLTAAKAPPEGIREEPGLFICQRCTHLLGSLPNLQRDETDPDDVGTEQNDHEYDALRYWLRRDRVPALRSGRWRM